MWVNKSSNTELIKLKGSLNWLLNATCSCYALLWNKVCDAPSRNGFSNTLPHLPLCQRKKVLYDRMERIIDEVVIPQEFSTPHEVTDTVTSTLANPHIQRVQLKHNYSQSSASFVSHRHLPRSVLSVVSQPTVSLLVCCAAPYGILSHASADGLLQLEFKDVIREGDSVRILRRWKVLLMYYNYASEAFHLISQATATASITLSRLNSV